MVVGYITKEQDVERVQLVKSFSSRLSSHTSLGQAPILVCLRLFGVGRASRSKVTMDFDSMLLKFTRAGLHSNVSGTDGPTWLKVNALGQIVRNNFWRGA